MPLRERSVAVHVDRHRVPLADGAATTVHVVRHPLATLAARVVRLAEPLEAWCARRGVTDAVSGGFAVKPELEPLGELWVDGRPRLHRPFRAPWRERRGTIVFADAVTIDARDRLPARPDGDLLQAGPLLVRNRRSLLAGVDDPEGFRTTADEFDQDLTADREPRLAVAIADGDLLAVAADGRSRHDAGLTLHEFADTLVTVGARAALNLDGGSAGVVVAAGRRVNTPRDDEGEALERSSPSTTAIVLSRR